MGPFPRILRARPIGWGVVLIGMLLLVLQAPFWWFALFGGFAAVVAYFGTTQIGSHFYMPTYCRAVSRVEKRLALTFDDGIVNPEQTQQIQAVLERYGVQATFFCIGKNLQQPAQQTALKALHQAGHLIGNHSFSHANLFDFYGASRVLEEVQQTDALVETLIGRRPLFFRPPYGITTPNIAQALAQSPHQTIGWSLRSLDTVIKQEALLLKRLKNKLHPGAIVLMHDHVASLPVVLPLFLDYVLKEGYSVVGLDELLDLPAYA